MHIKRKKFITGQTITGRRWEHGMPMNNTQRRLVEIFRGHRGKKKFRCISKDFYGTTYAKINYARQADKIEIYEPADKLRVVYNMGEKKTKTLYDVSFLKTADQYSVFTGGNQAVLEITGGIKNGKTLLLIKDSFANSILPFWQKIMKNLSLWIFAAECKQRPAFGNVFTYRYTDSLQQCTVCTG